MVNIQIEPSYENRISPEIIEKAVDVALSTQPVPQPVDLSVVVTSDEQIQDLNRQYLGIDAPTDVLSFPSAEMDPDTGERYLGDIVISYPRALEQANNGGHTVIAEFQLLVVHGILHLIGFDHGEPDEKKRMWGEQAIILEKLGSQLRYPPE